MDAYRAITITLALTALSVWCIWLWKHRNKWGYAVGVLVWLGSVLAFNLTILFIKLTGADADPLFFNKWSHVNYWIMLIYVIGAALIWWNNGRRE